MNCLPGWHEICYSQVIKIYKIEVEKNVFTYLIENRMKMDRKGQLFNDIT